MADSISRPVATTSSPRRDLASASALAAGMNSASRTTGERPGEETRMSGRSPGWSTMIWGVLGAHDASGQHLAKKLAECVVGAGFGLLRHWSGLQDGRGALLFLSS